MVKNYSWTDNPTEANVAVYDPDILNECLMHLKYQNDTFQKFCVNSANVNANGNPDLLSYIGNVVKFNCGNSLVSIMTNNSQSGWTLSGSHQIVSASNDICTSFNNNHLNYCSIQHTPSEEIPAFITIEKSADFSFDYLYLKFKTTINPGDIKSFRILDENDNVLYSYDNFGDYIHKDEFLIPIYNFNGKILKLLTTSNVNDATYTNFPSIIKLLEKTQVIALTNTKGEVGNLVGIADFTIPSVASKTYNIFVGTDGIVEAFSTNLSNGIALPSSPTIDQIHLLTCIEPLQAKKYNGTAWEDYIKVPVGYAKTNSSGVITEIGTFAYNQNGYNVNINTSTEFFYPSPLLLFSGAATSNNIDTGVKNSIVGLVINYAPTNNNQYGYLNINSDVITSPFTIARCHWAGSIALQSVYVEIPTKNGIISIAVGSGYNSTNIVMINSRKMIGV